MRKTRTDKNRTFQESVRDFLRDREVRKACDALEADDAVKRALIELRIKNKQTQKNAADRLATKQAYVSRVERGDVSPTVTCIAKMADALNADAEIVFRPRASGEVVRAVLVKKEKAKYATAPGPEGAASKPETAPRSKRRA